MRALAVLAAAALALFLIGQVRVGGRAEFNAEGFFLWIRLGRFHIRLLPAKPKKEKEPQEQTHRDISASTIRSFSHKNTKLTAKTYTQRT